MAVFPTSNLKKRKKTGHSKWPCPYCGGENTWIKRKHAMIRERPGDESGFIRLYRCESCGKGFKTGELLLAE